MLDLVTQREANYSLFIFSGGASPSPTRLIFCVSKRHHIALAILHPAYAGLHPRYNVDFIFLRLITQLRYPNPSALLTQAPPLTQWRLIKFSLFTIHFSFCICVSIASHHPLLRFLACSSLRLRAASKKSSVSKVEGILFSVGLVFLSQDRITA